MITPKQRPNGEVKVLHNMVALTSMFYSGGERIAYQRGQYLTLEVGLMTIWVFDNRATEAERARGIRLLYTFSDRRHLSKFVQRSLLEKEVA